jgi:hypothetical protein
LFHNVVTALNGGVVSNLTVSSGGKVTVFSGGTDLGVAILNGGIVIVSSGGLDTGAAIGSGGTELVSVGGTAVAAATIGSGALLETANGGTAIVSGTVLNSGTFIASGPGSLLEIVSGAAVTGGAVIVGNGILDVLSGGSADVAFLATGSGGLVIADTQNATSAFAGKVSGFGGASHSNHKQFIDLTSVTFVSGQIHLSYTSAASHTSGTLFVSSGGAVVAAINMIGAYTSANFSGKADSNGNVEIVDPTVPNGGSIESFPSHGIEVPNIAFGAHTTLAYSENSPVPNLGVTEGPYAAALALLGNYMAGSFATAAGGQGGTLVTQASQIEQPLLTHPRA